MGCSSSTSLRASRRRRRIPRCPTTCPRAFGEWPRISAPISGSMRRRRVSCSSRRSARQTVHRRAVREASHEEDVPRVRDGLEAERKAHHAAAHTRRQAGRDARSPGRQTRRARAPRARSRDGSNAPGARSARKGRRANRGRQDVRRGPSAPLDAARERPRDRFAERQEASPRSPHAQRDVGVARARSSRRARLRGRRQIRAALGLAFERRWGLLRAIPKARATSVFRLANEEGDGLTGLSVDYYAGWVVASFSGDLGGSAENKGRVLDALAAFGFDGVYEKTRPKHASALSDSDREAMAPALPSRGGPAASPLAVMEEGVPFLVRLDAGLATGFYADQRKNRRRVRAHAAGRRVLNLFSYTCSFSVVAALGGASRTVSVDASASALERGRESFAHARIDLAAHDFVAMDARAFLERAQRKGDRFDLVILDPPSFGTAKGGRFSIADGFSVTVQARVLRSRRAREHAREHQPPEDDAEIASGTWSRTPRARRAAAPRCATCRRRSIIRVAT